MDVIPRRVTMSEISSAAIVSLAGLLDEQDVEYLRICVAVTHSSSLPDTTRKLTFRLTPLVRNTIHASQLDRPLTPRQRAATYHGVVVKIS